MVFADLSASLGHVGEIYHPEVVAAIKEIIAKANAKGVKIGCFADTVEGGKKWRDLGVKFIGYACDTYIFMQAAKADAAAFAKAGAALILQQLWREKSPHGCVFQQNENHSLSEWFHRVCRRRDHAIGFRRKHCCPADMEICKSGENAWTRRKMPAAASGAWVTGGTFCGYDIPWRREGADAAAPVHPAHHSGQCAKRFPHDGHRPSSCGWDR